MIDGSINSKSHEGSSLEIKEAHSDSIQFEEVSSVLPIDLNIKHLALMCIPVGGIIYQMYLEREITTLITDKVNDKHWNAVDIKQLIANKNTIKKYSLIALGVNTFAAALFLGLFPLVAAMVAAGYFCFFIKNLVQLNANSQLIQRITEGSTIPPGGPNQKVPRDKTVFKLEDVE